jgi:hypothetical protein
VVIFVLFNKGKSAPFIHVVDLNYKSFFFVSKLI